MCPEAKVPIIRAGFNYLKDETLYPCWGDWFAVLCATIANPLPSRRLRLLTIYAAGLYSCALLRA
jgi:hypothetical protein